MAITKRTNDVNDDVKVTRVKAFDNGGIRFDMVVNGITIYNMSVVGEGEKQFFSFPSTKAKDGKYYSHCHFKITDELQKAIESQIEALL